MTTSPQSGSTSVPGCTYDRGAIVRGPKDKKQIALIFTGGDFADGGTTIADALKQRSVKAGFFFTGDFFRHKEFHPIIHRLRDEGHYLGPHSDKHLLYASWEEPPKLLVKKEEFDEDLSANLRTLAEFGVPAEQARLFIPPYEHYTPEIAEWTAARGMVLFNYTPGTLSHTDYMEDDDPRYKTSEVIVKSILDREAKSGLNGWIMLIHIGASPKRTRDHLYDHVGFLVDELRARGYEFVRLDSLIGG